MFNNGQRAVLIKSLAILSDVLNPPKQDACQAGAMAQTSGSVGTAKPDTLGMREGNGLVGMKSEQDMPRAKTPNEVAAASAKDMNHLLSNMDAQVWAAEFCNINKASDHGTMLTWFACAIMTGFDEANRRAAKDADELRRIGVEKLQKLNTKINSDTEAFAKHMAEATNIIKSLTAQNSKKQEMLNCREKELTAMRERMLQMENTSVPVAISKLIDHLAANKLI